MDATADSATRASAAGTGASAAEIRLEGISKVYADGTVGVAELDLTFAAGELTVLVGPSGCGKTTTMKMINRVIEPTGGRIFLGDEDVTKVDPVHLRRRIGYVIQRSGCSRTSRSAATSAPCRGCSAGTSAGSPSGPTS